MPMRPFPYSIGRSCNGRCGKSTKEVQQHVDAPMKKP